ncbi:MAG: hypothetical protein WA754_11405 [Pseudolabrys sp.]
MKSSLPLQTRAGRAAFCFSGTVRRDSENALADSAIYVEVPADSRKNRTAIKKYDSESVMAGSYGTFSFEFQTLMAIN